jgi:PAS domain S-box-containing protein
VIALRQIGIAAAYIVAGKFGLGLAFVHASASAVWPPSGIAIAALLLYGVRCWPAVFAGAVIVNLTTSGHVLSSIGIAAGNTAEAVVAAVLVNRFAGGVTAFSRTVDLFKYVGLVIVATAISATVGTGVLTMSGEADWARFGPIWLTWWIGDAIAACALAPAIVLWLTGGVDVHRPARIVEAALIALAVALTALIDFAGLIPGIPDYLPLEFICIPPCLWAAFRFGAQGGATAALILSSIALWATSQGVGPFARDPASALPVLQSFIGVVAVTALTIGALVAERGTAEAVSRQLTHDLSQRVRERTVELEDTAARLVEAQQVAHIGSWEWHVADDRVWWSDELYRIYGLDASSFTASFTGFLDRVHPDDRDRVQRFVRAALDAASPMTFEHRIVRPDGTERWLQASGRVVTTKAGRPVRLVGTGQDITERKRLEAQRAALAGEQAARWQAEQANRQKDEFLAMVSHELRTPLNAIVGWLHLLRKKPLDAETTRAVEVIDRNSDALRRIIEDILDLSAIQSGKLRLDRQPQELHPTLQLAIESMRPKAEARNITVVLDTASEPVRIVADGARLQQIVANLLTNAVKFTPPGGRITVSWLRQPDAAAIRITDTGIGIAEEVRPGIFDAFRQGDASLTRGHGGLGLGLAISRHLVELHGGTIEVDSPGRDLGTTFTVRLPMGADADATPVPVPERPTIAGALTGVSVLLVEDDPDGRDAMERGLRAAGAGVVAAGSAGEASEKLLTLTPDLFVVDIRMPGKDGYTFVRELRAAGYRTPAMAVTAHASEDDRRRALDAGFDRHVTKPVDLQHLVRTAADLVAAAKTPTEGPAATA